MKMTDELIERLLSLHKSGQMARGYVCCVEECPVVINRSGVIRPCVFASKELLDRNEECAYKESYVRSKVLWVEDLYSLIPETVW